MFSHCYIFIITESVWVFYSGGRASNFGGLCGLEPFVFLFSNFGRAKFALVERVGQSLAFMGYQVLNSGIELTQAYIFLRSSGFRWAQAQ